MLTRRTVRAAQRRPFLLVALAAFLVLLTAVTLHGKLTAATWSTNEQLTQAKRLLHGSGFVCPVGPERNDPSSWYSPGYVAYLAGILAVVGEDTAWTLPTIRVLNIAVMSVAIGLFFLLGRRLFGGKIALLATGLVLFNPAILSKAEEIWDTPFVMLCLALLLILFVLGRPKRKLAVFGSGLACGAAAMINPCLTACYPLWVAYSWWRTRKQGDRALAFCKYSGLVLGGFLLAILPWTVRNVATFGSLFYLRGNLPLEMWVGNAPWSDGYALSGDRHPVTNPQEGSRMVALGEYGYFQACRADLARWWKEDPNRFFTRSLQRAEWFWLGRYDFPMSESTRLLKLLAVAVPTLLGIVGAGFAVARRRSALVLLGTLMIFPLIYYVATTYVRYRLPVEPVLLLLGAMGVIELAGAASGVLAKAVRVAQFATASERRLTPLAARAAGEYRSDEPLAPAPLHGVAAVGIARPLRSRSGKATDRASPRAHQRASPVERVEHPP